MIITKWSVDSHLNVRHANSNGIHQHSLMPNFLCSPSNISNLFWIAARWLYLATYTNFSVPNFAPIAKLASFVQVAVSSWSAPSANTSSAGTASTSFTHLFIYLSKRVKAPTVHSAIAYFTVSRYVAAFFSSSSYALYLQSYYISSTQSSLYWNGSLSRASLSLKSSLFATNTKPARKVNFNTNGTCRDLEVCYVSQPKIADKVELSLHVKEMMKANSRKEVVSLSWALWWLPFSRRGLILP